jgi:hypothetical protein
MRMKPRIRTGSATRGVAISIVLVVLAITLGTILWWALAFRGWPAEAIEAGSTWSAMPAAVSTALTAQTAVPPESVTPTRDENSIRERAIAHLDRMSDAALSMGLITARKPFEITSVAAAKWTDVGKIEARAGGIEDSPDASRIVWIVRGEGDFLVARTPPGREPWVGESGYLLIDDETLVILGMGTP